jgi:predicted exporter
LLAPLVADDTLAGYDTVSALAPSLAGQQRRHDEIAAMDPPAAADRLARALAARGARVELFAPGLAPLRAPLAAPRITDPWNGPIAPLARRFLAQRNGRIVFLAYVRPRAGRDRADTRARVERALAAADRSIALTGYPLLEADVRAALRSDVARVGGLAALLVAVLLFIALRSARRVALALGGVAIELLTLVALLGALRVPLDAYNLLAVPVLVGITIDEIVFVLHAYDEATGTPRERARTAVESMVRATSATAGATAAGFLALLACRFEALRGLGIVAGAGTLLGLACALVVVPALARLTDRATA